LLFHRRAARSEAHERKKQSGAFLEGTRRFF
jgi:hypothetical protein